MQAMDIFGDSRLDTTSLFNIFADSIIVTDDMINAKVYNGSEPKQGVTINGVDYVMKAQKNDWFNVQSEIIASQFIQQLGGYTHNVRPGYYKGKQVALCEDFCKGDRKLKTLSSLSESSLDTDDNNHSYYLEDILYELSRVRNLDLQEALDAFYQMYTFDTILGNSDRHKGNWGIISDKGKHYMAPIFDNGASLFPRNQQFVVDASWMHPRIIDFPNSKIMFCNKPKRERSSYFDVWRSDMLPKHVKDWAATLEVDEAITNVCTRLGLSKELSSYYSTIINYRFNVIVKRECFVWRGMYG